MTDHPALQPVLRRADVTTLLGYIATERDNATAESIRLAKRADVTVEHAIKVVQAMHQAEGLARAHELVTQMWQAAVIATNAVNAGLVEDDDDE